MSDSISEIRKYEKHLVTYRSPWDKGIWKDIAENILPSREDMRKMMQRGERKAKKIYDSSPMVYLNIYADGLHGNMINPSIQWFILRLPKRYRFLEEKQEVRVWLQNTQEELYYAFGESNYYSEKRQYFRDGGSIGTATNYTDHDKSEDKLVFHTLHPRECFIAENKFGKVDVLFRIFDMTARTMKQEFGEENLPAKVLQSLRDNPFTEHTVVNAVYPNNEFKSNMLGTKYKKFASKWYCQSQAEGQDKFLGESGYDQFPYQVWRHTRGEVGPYGDSPAVYALPEIMGLQSMGKTLLRAGHFSAAPAYNVPAEMKGRTRIIPDGLNYFGADHDRKISAIQAGMQYQIGLDREEKKDAILKRHYHVNYFLMLEQSERQMTAREVIEKSGEKASILSASIGDLTVVLDQEIDYVYEIETRAGRIDPPPDIVLEYMGGKRIPIEYMGPLAQAQKRLFETRGIVDSLEMLAPFFEMFPQVADNFNLDKTAIDLANSFGFPQDNYNSPETLKSIRDGRAQQEQDELKKIDMERLADTLKALSQASKNSPAMTEEIKSILGGAMQPAGGGGIALPA